MKVKIADVDFKIAGQNQSGAWLEVDTKCLYINEFHMKPIPGLSNKSFYLHRSLVEEIDYEGDEQLEKICKALLDPDGNFPIGVAGIGAIYYHEGYMSDVMLDGYFYSKIPIVPWAIIVIAMGDFISGTCILFGAGILLTIIHGINGYIVTTSRKKLQEIKSIMNHNN